MTKEYLIIVLVRMVLPLGLLASIVLRPFGLSLIYLLLYLILPLTRVPTSKTFSSFPGKYLLIVFIVSVLLLISHAVWHGVLAAFVPYGSLLDDYPIIEEIGANVGYISYDSIDVLTGFSFLGSELVMTAVSGLVYVCARKLSSQQSTDSPKDTKHQQFPMLTVAGKYVALFLIMFAGIMRPSVPSAIYFLTFMGAATAWSVGRSLDKAFAVVCRCLMAIMAAHVAVLLVYQVTWVVDLYPPSMDFARYFGLTRIVNITETSFSYVLEDNHPWATYANPLVILAAYFVLAVESREIFKPKAKKKPALPGMEEGKLNGSLVRGLSFHRRPSGRHFHDSKSKKVRVSIPYLSSKRSKTKAKARGDDEEAMPLFRKQSMSQEQHKRWSSMRSTSVGRRITQDSIGSVIMGDDESFVDPDKPTLVDNILGAVVDLFQVLVRSSYIATTITMMAWSIMFHSWLTFVFLMWANVVWLKQDQRSFMLRTSPVLVVYAMLLLLAQYVYGMDLTEAELPSNITSVNLRQIGLSRADGEPCVPLLIKTLFTCMFWVTLRQRVQEIKQRRRSVAVTDIAAPALSTAHSAVEAQREEEKKPSRLLHVLGEWLRSLCARYWIYVVVIMLFVIGITGERMTIFRIIYMFLFLVFILVFQISWHWWRRLMYMFWITVIFYSMINLILIYVYQFDNFSVAIEKYLWINERLQNDLGLQHYHPADLFVRLLTPTLFLIITIMQVHYFHKDFMALSDTKSTTRTRSNSLRDINSSRPSQGGAASTMKDDLPQLPMEDDRTGTPVEADNSLMDGDHSMEMSSLNTNTRRSVYRKRSRARSAATSERQSSTNFRTWLEKNFVVWRREISEWVHKIFIFLDIHLIKIIMIALMLLCVVNVCAMHVPIMLLISPVLLFKSRTQRIVVLIISILISIYFMAKMVYQIDYIKHSFFDVNCTSLNENDTEVSKTYNNAEWIGFRKATPRTPLVVLLKGYIGCIAVFTFYSLVTYRQRHIRELGLLPSDTRDKLMFPDISRQDADKDMIHFIKYLFNYGFYKFGVEITLICLMGVIGSRMDVYAVIYAVWLLALTAMRRQTQARAWLAFTLFVCVLVPVQYLVAVGVLPQFCAQYPWAGSGQQVRHIRTWLFLPYPDDPPHATKLIFDYLLLLFAARQLRVFRVERIKGDAYEGGSNCEETGAYWETPHFVNPVPDFLGFVGTWLDVLKRMVFLGMLWVTLAIMFLTGTNRVNLFSMGYLVGSFIFLWQGTDFYLLPKHSILMWWSWLLRYNVSVVTIKTLLQIPGCIFATAMQDNACWLVQLLGIGCVDKFAGGNIARFLKMSYTKDAPCSVPQEDIGLAWDGVCFAFLILQRRLFHSYYFYRVIDESKATTVLASRGAELIESLRQKQMHIQEEQEVKILEKIKVKMERIKANQKKIQGTLAKEPLIHDNEEEDDEEEDMDETQEGERVPLVRGDSDASRDSRGFHTPDSPASPRGFHTPLSEASAPPTPTHTPPPPEPELQPQLPPLGGPPSPSSALMTASLSLDAYLEPRRISFGSPPNSELLPRTRSPEESYPVFSPPPIRRRHTVASPSLLQRTSIISTSSRSDLLKSHHTFRDFPVYRPPRSHQRAVRSGDYYMFDEFDDQQTDKEEKSDDEDEDAPKEMGFGKLLATVIKTDLKQAVALRRASAPAVHAEHRLSLASHPHSYAHEYRPTSSHSTHKDSKPPSDVSEKDGPVSADDTEEPELETWFDKVKRYLEALWMFIVSIIVSLTKHLMRYSRDYRYVSRMLAVEKKVLKEREGFGIGLREGSQMRWEPMPETLAAEHRKLSQISVPEIRILAPSMERGLDARTPPPAPRPPSSTTSDDTSEHESAFTLQSTGSKDVSLLEEHEDSMFKHGRSPVTHLVYAAWYAVLAHTDIVCYIMVFINQIQSATILSIPLPLMVFLWGTLTIPRPTKTFWVTLIAYTEVIVLIKSMFQFEMLPWNQKVVPANMPFTAPRIIGIERKSDYALYDLLLLLIIFLHRFMLKSLGLWKESTPEIELRDDVEYSLKPEDTQMLVEGKGEEVGRKYAKLHDRTGPGGDSGDNLASADSRSQTGDTEEEPGPSKPDNEDVLLDDDQEPIIAVTTTLERTYDYYPNVIVLSMKRYLRPTVRFFKRMLTPGARVTADVYAYMFLCDFFNFLVVIFGFAAFGTHQGDGGVQTYLEENKVPIPFLVMLILQFALIVIDRALYLRKFMLGKILFQYALIICVHVWMFFVLPFITERTFNALLPPPMWYMMKCIYLLLSAYQIRCGYPRRIIGNFLCKSYRFLNMVFFRGFMAVPFVFELRTLMDWIWTDTSMTLMDWLKMEDIFANVFLLKCSRYMEEEFPQPRGVKKSTTSKYLLGGSVLAFVIAIIWFPLVFFAFGNTVGQPNPPTDVTVKIRIGPFLPVYQMSAQSHNIDVYTEQDYSLLSNMYARDRTAQTFLSNYMYNDVAVVSLNPNSTMKWEISPPELDRLEREAASNNTLKVKFSFVITHLTNAAQNPPMIEDSREVELKATVSGQRNPERDTLYNMLTNKSSDDTWLNIKLLFPKFLKVFNKGTAKPAYQLMPGVGDTADYHESQPRGLRDDARQYEEFDDEHDLGPLAKYYVVDDARLYRDVQMRLERDKSGGMYWRVHESCTLRDQLLSIPMNNCDMLVMYTFNDKLFPETLNFISGSGIIGLYTTFVFLASRVIRGFFSGIYTRIMFDDLPHVDRVLQLCLDIYLVREALELTLEEDLFAKLVFLYRSPETMIKWSRPKEEEGDGQRALPPSR